MGIFTRRSLNRRPTSFECLLQSSSKLQASGFWTLFLSRNLWISSMHLHSCLQDNFHIWNYANLHNLFVYLFSTRAQSSGLIQLQLSQFKAQNRCSSRFSCTWGYITSQSNLQIQVQTLILGFKVYSYSNKHWELDLFSLHYVRIMVSVWKFR